MGDFKLWFGTVLEMMVSRQVKSCGVILKTFRSNSGFFVFVVFAIWAIACGSGSSQLLSEFMDELQAGASCEELFVKRNSVDPSDPIIDQMNVELSYIGCHSSSSTRTDLVEQNTESEGPSFTVKEYRIYRAVIDAPLSVPEDQALRNAAEEYDVTTEEALATVEKVMQVLLANGWYGRPEAEIRRASDWQGETE